LLLGIGQHALVAFGLGQLDQLERLLVLTLQRAVGSDRLVEMRAFAQEPLRLVGVVPELRILGERVQLVEASRCGIPVKETSSAVPATA
jgi:hypothetical protein